MVLATLLGIWGVIRIIVDLLESVQATAKYAHSAYISAIAAPQSEVLTVAVLIVGATLLYGEEIRTATTRLWHGDEKKQSKTTPATMSVYEFRMDPVRYKTDPDGMLRWYSLKLLLTNDSAFDIDMGASFRFYRIENDGSLTFLRKFEHGRWADGKYESPTSPQAEINIAHFISGQTRKLDVVMKYPDDQECYAANNDSTHVSDWRLSQNEIKGRSIAADVRLQGTGGFDRSWRLTFDNPGKGQPFSNYKYSPI